MTELRLFYPASVMAGQDRLTAGDIFLLRRAMFPDGLASPEDASQLLALHRCPAEKCPEWDGWFVEMITAYIVVHCWPQCSLDELNAKWMEAMFSTEGAIGTAAELEVVLHAMEMANFVPDTLSVLALDQLRLAVGGKACAYAASRPRRRGILAEDMRYVHRVLKGSLREGKMHLSAREKAVLERIDALVRSESTIRTGAL